MFSLRGGLLLGSRAAFEHLRQQIHDTFIRYRKVKIWTEDHVAEIYRCHFLFEIGSRSQTRNSLLQLRGFCFQQVACCGLWWLEGKASRRLKTNMLVLWGTILLSSSFKPALIHRRFLLVRLSGHFSARRKSWTYAFSMKTDISNCQQPIWSTFASPHLLITASRR